MQVKQWLLLSGIASLICSVCIVCLLLITSGQTVLASSTSHSYAVMGRPTITAARINQVLCGAGSPACGTGTALYSLGVKYGIDPAFALAFFNEESTYGKYGIASVNRGLGNIRCTPGYWCLNGFRAYHTWAAGYQDWYALIRYQYVNVWHLMTVPQIVQRYAPSSENNSALYIHNVEHFVSAWRR